MNYTKTKLSVEDTDSLQRKIVSEGYMPHTEQLGHLEYMSQYNIDGVEYLFHLKTIMDDVEVFILNKKGVVNESRD